MSTSYRITTFDAPSSGDIRAYGINNLGTGPRPLTLSDILRECDDPARMLTERAAWFREVLGNAIANHRDSARWLDQFAPQYQEGAERHRQAVARCRAALAKIEGI